MIDEQTESGLYVPKGMGKADETWTNDDRKKLVRFSRWIEEKKLSLVMVCQKCQKPVAFLSNETTGELLVECPCVRRTVRDI